MLFKLSEYITYLNMFKLVTHVMWFIMRGSGFESQLFSWPIKLEILYVSIKKKRKLCFDLVALGTDVRTGNFR